MNPTAIFSKTGKGVQEASGKTSQLSRPDRAVLSAIDGRATLGDVAQRIGKQFDNDFQGLINKLDKDGFIREVSPGAAAPAKPGAAPAKPASKPTAPMEVASDLDFTASMFAAPKTGAAPPPPPQAVARAPAPPPRPAAAVPPKPPPPSAAEQVKQAQIAKEQQSAFARAREEAERKAQADRDRVKSEAEAKVRAETETKLRAEAEEKAKADAEAKARKTEADAVAARAAAVKAAVEAKMKAEAEAKRAREEAERVKREAEEKAERARREAEAEAKRAREEAERIKREAEEKLRREQEELKRKLEEERRAREEAERQIKEEAERVRRELEEERRQLEEQKRRDEEERQARRKREEEEEAERARQKAEEKPLFGEDKPLFGEEKPLFGEEKPLFGDDKPLFEMPAVPPAPPAAPPPAPKAPAAAATGDAFADSLLADLDSFTQREDEERKAKEDAERKAKEEAARKVRDEIDRAERETAEAKQREDDERRRREEEAQRARDEEERRVRRQREEQEQAEREAEERRRKIAATSPSVAGGDDLGITDEDLALDEVKREAALLEQKKDRKGEREKEREKERALKKEREREAKARKEKEKEAKQAKLAKVPTYARQRRPSKWGRSVVVALFLLLAAAAGVVHVMPISTAEFERAATEAVGRPVKIASARFTAIGGVQYKLEGVSIGELRIPVVRAFPELTSILDDRPTFTSIELDGMTLPQDALADALFAAPKPGALAASRLLLKNLKLSGPLPLPPLDADVRLERGAVRALVLRGGEGLVARLAIKEQTVEFDVSTAQFSLPVAPGVTLVQFGMKGEATRLGLKIRQWEGLLFGGNVTGSADLRWGSTWTVDGTMTARGVNAAVFAPALLSSGRADGTGRFSMSGAEPSRLGATARLEGSYTVTKGVLGSVDLPRALQTSGRQMAGQTVFSEMSGRGTYDRGAVSLRDLTLTAGVLGAGASLDVAEGGALSGRIVADFKTTAQNMRMTFTLGGTAQEPQIRN